MSTKTKASSKNNKAAAKKTVKKAVSDGRNKKPVAKKKAVKATKPSKPVAAKSVKKAAPKKGLANSAKKASKPVAKKVAIKKVTKPAAKSARPAPKKVARPVKKAAPKKAVKPVKKALAKTPAAARAKKVVKAATKKVLKPAPKKVAPKKAAAPVAKKAAPAKKVAKPVAGKAAPVKAIKPVKPEPVKAVKPVKAPMVKVDKPVASKEKPLVKKSIVAPLTFRQEDPGPVKVMKEPNGKFEMEFVIRASEDMVFEFVSTESGLSEWFCDDVTIRNGVFTFIWDGQEQQAKLVKEIPPVFIRYQWMDKNDGSYFEFRTQKDELTNDISLIITDFASDKSDEESARLLWNSQVDKLLHVLGSFF